MAPVQKSASVDHVEKRLDVLAEAESESEEDKPPSKQQRTDQEPSDVRTPYLINISPLMINECLPNPLRNLHLIAYIYIC